MRELRRERGLTLKALGARAGLSHPFLSQLERGLARPSVGSVERIADALGVPVGRLWDPPAPAAVRVVRGDDGQLVAHDAPGAPGGIRELTGQAEPLSVREWRGGSRRWPEGTIRQPGQALVYVTRGALEIEVEDAVHALEEGDALFFDGRRPHRMRRAGGPSTRALIVVTA